MGLFLFGGMLAGCILGLVATVVLGAIGLVVAIRIAKVRVRAWWWFVTASVVFLTLFLLAVHAYPYDVVRPGSDYDVALKNLFLEGFGYCISPGLATLLAALVAMCAPKRAGIVASDTNTSPESATSRAGKGDHG